MRVIKNAVTLILYVTAIVGLLYALFMPYGDAQLLHIILSGVGLLIANDLARDE